MKINIIGDIAGRYDELMLLLEKMPEADLVLSVGDMVDRGPKSRQVIEWFMNTPNAEAIYGNHEDMFVEALEGGSTSLWMQNGGVTTAFSFIDEFKDCETIDDLIGFGKKYQYFPEVMEDVNVPAEVIEWLKARPMYFETDDLIVSHAPITSLKNVPADPYGRDYFFVWNRCEPSKPQNKYMVYGHNGRFKRHKWGDGSEFAMCVDNTHSGRLVGMHWPTKEVFTQDFLDREKNKDNFLDIKAE